MSYRRLWIAFALVIVGSFAVLGYFGREIYRAAPPVPERVVTTDGRVLWTGAEIKDGQNVWQSTGGQELGTVWGHGSYVAPDWSADWLHREAVSMLDRWAMEEHGVFFAELAAEPRAALQARLQSELRANTYDPETGDLVVSELRAEAIAATARHYRALFSDDPALADLREAYAMKTPTISDPQRLHQLTGFFFWTSWACVTERPGESITYTNNWPPDELVGNVPKPALHLWTGFSVILLIAGIGVLAWWYASHRDDSIDHSLPDRDPLLGLAPTPSMQATLKYFWVVTALIVVQVGLGAVTAHYGVEGSGFYGFELAEILPYS
jgi:nitric oxide reductase subunit B